MELKELKDKILEALYSALPITVLVYLMALTPWFEFSAVELVTFSAGAVLLVLGIGLFSMGADLAMTPMGTHVGSGLSKQRRLGLLLFVCFVLGMLITIAEPDLQVLANQVSAVMNGTLLIYAVGFGVGAFLVIAVLKIVFRKSLGTILNARDVAREDAAAFFGITLHAEKEILMMVVEKELRDTVLNAIYKEMGMAKKAQGIAFSLPVSEAVGLAGPAVQEKKED